MGDRNAVLSAIFLAKEAMELSASSRIKLSLKGCTELCSGQGFSDEHSLKPIAQEVNLSASPICFTTFIKGAAFSSSVSQKPPPGPLLELITFFRANICNIFAKKEVGICNASAMSLGANLLVGEACSAK